MSAQASSPALLIRHAVRLLGFADEGRITARDTDRRVGSLVINPGGSVALAQQLQSGVLLTHDGFGHTAYGHSTTCITDAVDTYLLTGHPPKAHTTCS